MKKLLALFALFMLLALPAAAEDSTGSGRWTAAGTCTGCFASPTATEAMVVLTGHRIIVDGTVSMTTGSITVNDGATLEVPVGSTLTPGAFLRIKAGGRYIQNGRELAACLIAREPDWSAADPVFPLNCPAGTNATTSDYLVGGEDDPESNDYSGHTLLTGPGTAPGALSANTGRFTWLDITALSGGNVTVDLDHSGFTFAAGGNAPYAGTRGQASLPGTIIPAGSLTYTVQPGRRATMVAVAAAYGSVVARHADLGSHYAYFTEDVPDAADPNDPRYCAGKRAKIMHTEDGGGGDDILFLAGDVSGCSLGSLRLIPGGFRRGDLVYLVRPATVDGFTGSAQTSHVRFESGSSIDVRWARFHRLGFLDKTTVTPVLDRHCNICFLQADEDPAAPISGRFMDVDIAYPESAVADAGVLYFVSRGGGDLRYPDAGLLDVGLVEFARLNIHDSRNQGGSGGVGGSGGHGVWMDAVKNLFIDGALISRISDDLFGGLMAGNATGAATDANGFLLDRGILVEGLAEDNNSQQCLEPQILDGATITTHNYLRQVDSVNIRNTLSMGCYFESLRYSGVGARIDGLVLGGTFDANSNRAWEVSMLTSAGITLDTTRPNRIRNSLLPTYTEDGTSAVLDILAVTELYDSVIWGDEQSADVGNRYQGITGAFRTFLYHAVGTTNYLLEGGSGAGNTFKTTRTYQDFAVVTTVGTRFAQNFNTDPTPYTVNFEHFLYAQTAAWNTGSPNQGPIGGITQEVGGVVNIDGAVFSTGTSGTQDFVANAGGSIRGVCLESNDTPIDDFDTYDHVSNVTSPRVLPDAASAPALGLLVGDPNDPDPCIAGLPRELGLARVPVSVVLLGDFVVEQFYPVWTSRRGLLNAAVPFFHPRNQRAGVLGWVAVLFLLPAAAAVRAARKS